MSASMNTTNWRWKLFDLEARWDRPVHTGRDSSEHVLRIRTRLRAEKGTVSLRVAVALDTSGSMEGEKLASAREACASVFRHLRPQDKGWAAAFSTKLT